MRCVGMARSDQTRAVKRSRKEEEEDGSISLCVGVVSERERGRVYSVV